MFCSGLSTTFWGLVLRYGKRLSVPLINIATVDYSLQPQLEWRSYYRALTAVTDIFLSSWKH
jgi:hypothetical protein